ncbi:uncharacterized protein H6S33_011662 [Morchella sextelata]|uniref:uncharacterized protein n=1 Tax=Morchella sextelata TaxID=1174677 RepID=UPI001D04BB02|nr:uncharacterized protein H6S33_011662 [Morchella sextelata]KAH0611235.1 hypothetical protein H6S33_011662 [Morchella sextelata]
MVSSIRTIAAVSTPSFIWSGYRRASLLTVVLVIFERHMRTWKRSFPDDETSNLVLKGIRHEILKRIKRTNCCRITATESREAIIDPGVGSFLEGLRSKLSTETDDDDIGSDEAGDPPFDDDDGEEGNVTPPTVGDYVVDAESQIDGTIGTITGINVNIENDVERDVSMMQGGEEHSGEVVRRRRGRPRRSKVQRDDFHRPRCEHNGRGATSYVQKTSSSLDLGTTSLRDGRRFSSLAFATSSVDQETQGSRRGAPRCRYAGKEPPFGPLYGMSREELIVLKRYIQDNLKKGFIQASSSPAGAPVLFVKKADGTLRLCVDYRGLNELTVKNRYPLPLIRETLDHLSKAKWYTKLDLRQGYNQIRMAEGEEWKTACRTRYGHFEYTVMPFGLTNAPATFQHFINDCVRDYLDMFCTAYLDDILIYSDTFKEHQIHVEKVLEALQRNGVLLKPEKCEFHTQSTTYLGLIIEPNGIKMDPRKVETVKNWTVPKTVKDVQAFLGFANFYRRFIRGFSELASPLNRLTRKDISFGWTPEAQTAFNALKEAFTTAPILTHVDPEKEITVETDASDYVSAGVLSQYDDNGTLRPVAYFSKKHSPAECNYEIYDKELLAIIRSFEEWRPELEGAVHPIAIISDHKNLEYFMSTKQLNRRQARWAEYLSRFNFVIKYRPGKQGGKPDALTRRSGDLPGEGDERQLHQSQVVLKKENLDAKLSFEKNGDKNDGNIKNESDDNDIDQELEDMFGVGITAQSNRDEAQKQLEKRDKRARSRAVKIEDDANSDQSKKRTRIQPAPTSLQELFDEGYSADPFHQKILDMRNKGDRQSKDISLAECTEVEGRLLYRGSIYVPDYDPLKLRILQLYHDAASAGHPGREKTFELIARYVRNCHTCQRSKPNTHGKLGVLRSLPIPEQPWQEVSMDFVTGLPESEGYDAIMVVVDRLTKMRHLLPCNTTVNSEDVAQLYLRNIWKLHGLPTHVTSERGTQFTAKFWKALCKHLNIEARMSTAFHPETDGQTERLNAVMEQYLRGYVSYQQDDWVKWLPMAEFSANNQVSASTKATPFFANYGFHPRFTVTIKSLDRTPPSLNAKDFALKMKELHGYLRSNIRTAQDQQEQAVNTKRTPAPRYDIGDMVFVSAKNIRTTRNSRKLDWKKLGPFPVKEIISPYAYRVDLPRSMKMHPVFHVSLLDPAANDPEYAVEEILDSRETRNGGLQYFVKWTGYTDPTWEPAAYHDNTAAVDIFHTHYPDKPGPLEGKIKVKARRSSRLKGGATFMDRLVEVRGYEELD